MKIAALMMIVAFLAGCAERTWTHPGATQQRFTADAYACESEAARLVPAVPGATAYPVYPAYPYGSDIASSALAGAAVGMADSTRVATDRRRDQLAVRCMQAKGYTIQ